MRDHQKTTGIPNSVKKIVHRFFKVQMQDLRASKWYYEQYARIEPTFDRLDRENELFHVAVVKGRKLDPPIDVLANLSMGARRYVNTVYYVISCLANWGAWLHANVSMFLLCSFVCGRRVFFFRGGTAANYKTNSVVVRRNSVFSQ